MATALVNPDLIQWARERSRLSPELAAEHLKKDPAVLAAWESGAQRPTFSQARDLARKFHVPFGYLFLSKRPDEELPIPDLRTRRDSGIGEFSVDFKDVLNDALRKQLWYKEHLEAESEESLPFVGRFAGSDDWKAVAADISATVGIPAIRSQAKNWSDFFLRLVWASEAIGVLVLRNSIVGNDTHRKLDVEEFLGFALSDPIAPLVFVNTAYYKAAQTFTLAHELAHLWLDASGVSNPDPHLRASEQGSPVEVTTNQIAAEVLVPGDDFDLRWRSIVDQNRAAGVLAEHYKVSGLVILRKALDAGLLTSFDYRQLYRDEVSKQTKRRPTGGNFQPSLLARSSPTLTMALMASVSSERTGRREAAGLLGVHTDTLKAVMNNLRTGGP